MSAKFIKIEAYIYSHFSAKLMQRRKMRRVEYIDIFLLIWTGKKYMFLKIFYK